MNVVLVLDCNARTIEGVWHRIAVSGLILTVLGFLAERPGIRHYENVRDLSLLQLG
jgi:hypothetical protein